MPLHLITGHKGEAHISSADIGAFNAGIFGQGEYVLDLGRKFEIEVVTNNLVKIYDGDLVMQGRHISLKNGSYEELTIENGTADMNRIDLIVARYRQDIATGIESAEFAVIKGTATAGEATAPEYTTGDILSGGCVLHEMPLYKIPISGLVVGEPESLFSECGAIGDAMTFRGWNPLNSIAEDTPQKWKELGTGIYMIDLPDRIIGQPSQWGLLYNTVCAEEVAQKFIVQASGETYRRNANGLGWYGADWRSGEWATVFDSLLPQTVTGTYTGNNEYEQFIDLGFTPSAVEVYPCHGYQSTNNGSQYSPSGGLALKGHDCSVYPAMNTWKTVISVVENGFKVYKSENAKTNVNMSSLSSYFFVAIR